MNTGINNLVKKQYFCYPNKHSFIWGFLVGRGGGFCLFSKHLLSMLGTGQFYLLFKFLIYFSIEKISPGKLF